MVDKVRPLKLENASTGGTETDMFPTEVDVAEDYLAAKGIAFDNSDSNLLVVVTSVLTSSLNFSAPLLVSSSLSSGRVVYTTAGGQLTADASFTYNGTTVTHATTISQSYSSASATNALTLSNTWSNTSGTSIDLNITPTISNASSSSGSFFGLNIQPAYSSVSQNVTGHVRPITVHCNTPASSTTISNNYGLLVQMGRSNAGTVSTQVGLYVNQLAASAGTITTMYGMYIENMTAGGTNYAIYSNGGQSIHVGNLRIGSTSNPSVALDVVGNGNVINTSTQTVFTVGSGTASSANTIVINGASGGFRRLGFQTNGTNRWLAGASEHTESGSNAGSAFRLSAYDDAGTFIDNTIFITRGAADTSRVTVTGQFRHITSNALVTRFSTTGGSAAELRLDSNSTSLYTSIQSNSTQTAIAQVSSSSSSLLDLNALAQDGSSVGVVRINRQTSTTATATGLEVYRGDNTANVVHKLYSKAAGNGVVFNEEGSDIDFRVEGDTEANLLFVDASTDKIGINSSAIPHGGIGWAKIAIDGANASSSGPHMQFTTATDDYPLLQLLNYAHDNVTLLFDSYYDGSVFRSAHTTPSFLIRKYSNFFRIMGAPATTQGADLSSSLINMVQIRGTGEVSLDRGFDMSYNSLINEDWISNSESGIYGWSTITADTGDVSLNSSLIDQNHWGIIRLHVENDTDPDLAGVHLMGTVFGGFTMRLGAGAVFFECVVYVETLGSSTQDFDFFIGLGDTGNGPSGVNDAVGFYYNRSTNSGAWTLLTKKGGSATNTSTGSTVAAATWVRLGFLVAADGSSVTPFVNGTASTAATTNIPTASTELLGPLAISEKTNGTTTSRNVYIDYYKMAVRFTNQR